MLLLIILQIVSFAIRALAATKTTIFNTKQNLIWHKAVGIWIEWLRALPLILLKKKKIRTVHSNQLKVKAILYVSVITLQNIISFSRFHSNSFNFECVEFDWKCDLNLIYFVLFYTFQTISNQPAYWSIKKCTWMEESGKSITIVTETHT